MCNACDAMNNLYGKLETLKNVVIVQGNMETVTMWSTFKDWIVEDETELRQIKSGSIVDGHDEIDVDEQLAKGKDAAFHFIDQLVFQKVLEGDKKVGKKWMKSLQRVTYAFINQDGIVGHKTYFRSEKAATEAMKDIKANIAESRAKAADMFEAAEATYH